MPLKSRHLLGLEGMTREEIELIFETADSLKEILDRPIKKVPILTGITVVNLFFEPSTRTRISFELAERRLSAEPVNFSSVTSSVKKGETLKDTVQNIEAMKIDMVVVRHASAGVPYFLTTVMGASIINAGDGMHEHPTQGLLDMYTLRERFDTLKGLKVLIVGDLLHSRVAGSNLRGLPTMGAEVTVCGPPTMIPIGIEQFGVKVAHNLDEVIADADVIMALRIQLERQQSGLFPSLREYHELYGITRDRLKKAKPEVIIMHPGPINRGVEIEADVADGPSSVILTQVTNGLAIRMAILYLLGQN